VGAVLGPTDWLRVDRRRIDAFAEVSGDHQWIHVDPVRARESAFGSTIAHGYLTLSLCSHFLMEMLEVTDVSMAVNYGVDRVRFPSPVPVGSELVGEGRVVSVDDVAGGVQTKIELTASIPGAAKPACVAEILVRHYA
jgi:acyl dehydratase